MKKTFLTLFVLLVVGVGIFYFLKPEKFKSYIGIVPQSINNPNSTSTVMKEDLYNMSYTIDGESFTLVGGVWEGSLDTSSGTKSTVQIVKEPAFGDLNNDGKKDAALWLTKKSKGVDPEYYAAITLNKDTNYESVNTIPLGKDILPEAVIITENQASYVYKSHDTDEPKNSPPTMNSSVTVVYDALSGQATVPSKSIDIETNLDAKYLVSKSWEWLETNYTNNAGSNTKSFRRLLVNFNQDGTFSASTDCSGVGGNFGVTGNNIYFEDMPGTLMYCGNVPEVDFRKGLAEVQTFSFAADGKLVFTFGNNSGTMLFK